MQGILENPFDQSFEFFKQASEAVVEDVNIEPLELLTKALTSRSNAGGRMILLRAPRAGFGKTHVLSRLHRRLAHSHEFITLEPVRGRGLHAAEVLEGILRAFTKVVPESENLTNLDLLARRLFAIGLEPLVRSGEVPSEDLDSALRALKDRPVETFDFHDKGAATAKWAKANFNVLGSKLAIELAERTGSNLRPVAWWVDLLFQYSSTPLDRATRGSVIFASIFSHGMTSTDMYERLEVLLNLMGLITSPVLVLDQVDLYSGDPSSALEVASFLSALHQSCDKLAVILSMNGDVWETAFNPRLPSSLKDRFSDIVVELKPMTREQATELIKARAGEHADKILDAIDLDIGVIYARGVMKKAAEVWDELKSEEEPAEEPIGLSVTPNRRRARRMRKAPDPDTLEAPESEDKIDDALGEFRERYGRVDDEI